ncbi:MAG: phage portal protein [Muribaculaceae bacterium]|nr:phage portal protein [Muribaculaceae bacterium]
MVITSDILNKRPWTLPVAKYNPRPVITSRPESVKVSDERFLEMIVPQLDFLRQYYPSGHLINDTNYYPDRLKYDEERKQFFTEKVVRCAFPFQMIITAQHLVHISGNDVRHELTDAKVDEKTQTLFHDWQKGWLNENIETSLYYLYKSTYTTGDGAVLFFLKEGKMYTKNLSLLYGDKLLPNYDPMTGKLRAFGRKFSDFDEESRERVQWLEVWDEKYLYRFRRDIRGARGAVTKIKEWFGLDGWVLDAEPEEHGFKRVPVSYHRRDEGACWSFVQDAIDKYELAVSYLCQNNMAYAFPIMVLQGDDIDIQGDIYGQVKAISADKDAKIGYLERGDNTAAFTLQLETLLKQIFLGSFAVQPPEVHSGDLPGVAVKLIYAPSLDCAMIDAKEFDHVIDDVRQLFTYAYGVQEKKLTQYQSLNIISYIEPYVHQNAAEIINNIVQAVNSGVLSRRTGSERTNIGRNNEYDRIILEQKEAEKADLLYQIKTQEINNNTNSNNTEE